MEVEIPPRDEGIDQSVSAAFRQAELPRDLRQPEITLSFAEELEDVQHPRRRLDAPMILPSEGRSRTVVHKHEL